MPMGGAPSPPDMSAAAAQDAATQHPNMTTPWGSVNWTKQDNGQWNGNVNLTPAEQTALNSQQGIQQGQMDLAHDLQGKAAGAMQDPVHLQTTLDPAARAQAIDANYKSQTQYLDPQFEQGQQALQQQLASQGLQPGDAAYDTAMKNFGLQKQGAYSNANMQAINAGNQTEQTQIGAMGAENQMAMANQMMPLNEMLAVENGQQVQMPSFSAPGAGATGSALSGAMAQYQGQMGQYGANQAGIQGLESGAASLAPLALFAFSDERLKTEIVRHGVEVLPGVPLATWEWKGRPGSRDFGVIAQDVAAVRPDLVAVGPGGFLMVNYEGVARG